MPPLKGFVPSKFVILRFNTQAKLLQNVLFVYRSPDNRLTLTEGYQLFLPAQLTFKFVVGLELSKVDLMILEIAEVLIGHLIWDHNGGLSLNRPVKGKVER